MKVVEAFNELRMASKQVKGPNLIYISDVYSRYILKWVMKECQQRICDANIDYNLGILNKDQLLMEVEIYTRIISSIENKWRLVKNAQKKRGGFQMRDYIEYYAHADDLRTALQKFIDAYPLYQCQHIFSKMYYSNKREYHDNNFIYIITRLPGGFKFKVIRI